MAEYAKGRKEKDIIEIKDRNDKLKFVLKRNIIEEEISNLSTATLGLDAIKWELNEECPSDIIYGMMNCYTGKVEFSHRLYDTNAMIHVFTLEKQKPFDSNLGLDELYHINLEGMKFIFDVKNDLDKLYDQSFRRCRICGGIMDNKRVEDYYVYEAGHDYYGAEIKYRTVFSKCRDCKDVLLDDYIYGGLV